MRIIYRNRFRSVHTSLCALVLLALVGMASGGRVFAQDTEVTVQRVPIKTYPFGDPDPIPGVYRNEIVYPYFRFDGFSHDAVDQEWEVVTLENPHVRVTILPEVGGKVWGAIDKATGHQFIYENEVLKFRDIAVRGAWTSGGIEHNFGVYGHTPATATPVDYATRKNEDGSASVIVGAMDWTSRTLWRVTITLPKDAAYFEIENFWYNPSPLSGHAYHWLNAAVHAGDDLQFFFPGSHYIGHSGDAHTWPVDEEGRDISFYRNNNFGRDKAYHVLGEYVDFFGGYWHDRDFGFGHWARYSDAPGKKVWLWSLARSGGIWEDLLTDSDGQYVEAQAGWKFNQTNNSAGTPFGPEFFAPYVAETWTETWFPVKEIGGISDAARYGVMHVERNGGNLEIAVHALEPLRHDLVVMADGVPAHRELLQAKTGEVVRRTVALPAGTEFYAVEVGGPELRYSSDPKATALDRPVSTEFKADNSSAEWLFREGERHHMARRFARARQHYEQTLEREPRHIGAYVRLAELDYRRGEYDRAVASASTALELNTYHAGANFIYGLAQRRLGQLVDAQEAFGWAARSMEYRSGAYTQMAEIGLLENDLGTAIEFAKRALQFNTLNLSAYEALAIAHRVAGRKDEARRVLDKILEIDPLDHFARFERYLLDSTPDRLAAFADGIRAEFPEEVYLELAVRYANRGRISDAVRVLGEGPEDPIAEYWLAYLQRDDAGVSRKHLENALRMPPDYVFPFRLETIPVLEWAAEQSGGQDRWKTTYYLATLYWSKGQDARAVALYRGLGDAPGYAPFYAARAMLLDRTGADSESVVKDLERAIALDPDGWRARQLLIVYLCRQGQFAKALDVSREAYARFPGIDPIGLEHAAVLLENGQFAETVKVLDRARVLPHEGASRGHRLFEQAHLHLAIAQMQAGRYRNAVRHVERALEWPENLGVGRPFSPDERVQHYLLGISYRGLRNDRAAEKHLNDVVEHTLQDESGRGLGTYVGALALRELGRTKEAADLLDRWASTQPWQIARWARAHFQKDVRRAAELSDRIGPEVRDRGSVQLLQALLAAE